METALWWLAQVAARVGGVTVVLPDDSTRVLGNGRVQALIHATGHDSEAPPPGVLTVAIAPTLSDLPSWCDALFEATWTPGGTVWWHQCSAPASSRPQLPASVEADAVAPQAPQPQVGTLSAVLGVDSTGPVVVDLVADGPHAVVAGTTGSGKSEALLTWLLSLADRHSPSEVTFVLIDYKGGSAFAPLQRLPHVAAVLTDLDTAETERALRGLETQLRWRESELRRHKVPDVRSWVSAHRDGHAPAPPPAVLIVIDEFRELGRAHPDTLDTILRLASQGRSLGLHVIAATQRPGGALSPAMRANMELRLVLRCAERTDSVDLLGSAQAAELDRIPGRAVLAGRGVIQVARTSNVAARVDTLRARWPQVQLPVLWPPALPEEVSWAELFLATGDSAVPLALVDALDSTPTQPLPTLAPSVAAWSGGHIRIEGNVGDQELLAQAALAIASCIAERTGRPLHIVGDGDAESIGAHSVPLAHPIDVAHLFEYVPEHGPAVVAVENMSACLAALEEHYGQGNAQTLVDGLFRSPADSDVTVVAAHPGCGPDTHGRFRQRLIRALSAQERLRAFATQAPQISALPGRFLLAEGGQMSVCQCPLEPYATPSGPRAFGDAWAVASTEGAKRRACDGSDQPIAVGCGLKALQLDSPKAWIVIGDDTDAAVAAVRRWNALNGFGDFEISTSRNGPSVGQIQVLSSGQWMHLEARSDLCVMAPEPTPELVRSLRIRARGRNISAASLRWAEGTGLLLIGRDLRRFLIESGQIGAM